MSTQRLFKPVLFVIACLWSAGWCETDYASKRRELVNGKLRKAGIKDPQVIAAMLKVPRHELVPKNLRQHAYLDRPLPIGEDQTISQPYIVAYMTEQLKLKGDERVLEIGTGSGYQAAVLAEIAKEVYTIEIVRKLGERAKRDLTRLGYKNIHFFIGDGYRGWPKKAPFDAIIITAAPDHIPQPLVDQLAVGGRMILPVGDRWQELILVTRDKDGVKKQKLIGVRFVPMTGEAEKK
ncbi:MAG: protein-L-isoaspartate(D-aspartate) O-methyltransferase [Planctomycetota bacterium]|nr:protein-L-isoaspartate(D-aspartate) O-methyltransferase [Planctomycetota bacterium]